ncbi:nucleotidyl transferase AbiEii/AbiGii toxin family protein [Nostoc sp. UHCC 0702]|nr:nucleotidyl transferase AbiEii/AbiGii toxin family protein [Nostoc sp. UHCC 0702]
MTFSLEHHNKILTILKSLNHDVLKEGSAYFAGGTLLTLDYQEYRQSKDIDFISPVFTSGYKYLRTVVFDGGFEALFCDLSKIKIGRGTTDQYGIRMIVIVDDLAIKTEIIAESRFELDPPRYPEWSPVPCLSFNDCFTSKLLSNSDRYMDDSVEARDLIDLAILRLQSPIPQQSIEKAEKAYEVIRPLEIAVKRFQERPDYRQECFYSLQVNEAQIPMIIDGIDLLASDLDLEITERVFKEQHDIFDNLETESKNR